MTLSPVVISTIKPVFADLLIVGQDERPEIDLSAAGVVLGSGRPVLVLPEIGDFGAIGRRALVAWNASRESIRALNDSLPFLKRADEVHLVVVGARRGGQ